MSGRIATESLQIVFPRNEVMGADAWRSAGAQGKIASRSSRTAEEDAAPQVPALELSVDDWRSDDFSFWGFDRQVDSLAASNGGEPIAVRLRGESQHMAEAARQVLVRCQRLAGRRNAASSCDIFELVLSRHRRLFDVEQPQPASSAAEHARALDRWQWLLRLDPGAALEPQIAALFHDVERLTTAGQAPPRAAAGTPATLEAPDGEEARQARARQGSWIADELLVDLGIDLATRVRVHELIRGKDSSDKPAGRGGTAARELRLLRNADALSFFSLDSAGYLATAGAEPTRRKVACTLARMSPDCRAQLEGLRLCQPLRQMIARELARLKDARRHPVVVSGRIAAAGAGGCAAGDAPPRHNPLADRVIGPSGVLVAIDALGRRDGRPIPALVMARSRLAVGMLGAAALAPTRLAPLLARAQAIGALGTGAVSPAPSGGAAVAAGLTAG
jgi:hypothetical protein